PATSAPVSSSARRWPGSDANTHGIPACPNRIRAAFSSLSSGLWTRTRPSSRGSGSFLADTASSRSAPAALLRSRFRLRDARQDAAELPEGRADLDPSAAHAEFADRPLVGPAALLDDRDRL